MWHTIMAVNTFIIWPLCSLLLLYSVGRGILTWDWKLFVIAFIIWSIATLAETILGMLDG